MMWRRQWQNRLYTLSHPSRSNFFYFHAVFGEKLAKHRLALPTLGLAPRLGNPGSATAIASSSEAIGILTVNIENQRMLNGLISVDLACFLYWSSPNHRILHNVSWDNEAPHTAMRTDQVNSDPWGDSLCTLSMLIQINGVFQKKSTRFAKFDTANLVCKESILNHQFLNLPLWIDLHHNRLLASNK